MEREWAGEILFAHFFVKILKNERTNVCNLKSNVLYFDCKNEQMYELKFDDIEKV